MTGDAGEDILGCWLEEPPTPARLGTVCGVLVVRTTAADPDSADDARRAASPNRDVAFGLGLSLLHGGRPTHQDLGRCWLWVAASLGHARACNDLVRELVAEGSSPLPQRPPPEIMGRIGTWISRAEAAVASPPALPDPTKPSGGFSVAATALKPPSMVGHDAGEDPYAPYPDYSDLMQDEDGPGVVAIPRIGDPMSREGMDITKRFRHVVGRKLPYKGRLPEPGEVIGEFLGRFPWASGLGRYLEGQFAMLRGAGIRHPKLPPLLLVGPSGCGKTTMLEWLAATCEFPSMTIPIGGTSDHAGITAVARGWNTTQPSAPVRLMADYECCNPAIILDEVDKGVSDTNNQNGSVMGALLSILQPPAEGYHDTCLLANADISQITFMASANNLGALTDTLRKRFLVQTVPAPGPEHFDHILVGVMEKEARRIGIPKEFMPYVSDTDRAWLKSAYVGAKCSIRQLEQAFQVLAGERAAEESMAMRRPN